MTRQLKRTLRSIPCTLALLTMMAACTAPLPQPTPFASPTPEPTATPEPTPTPQADVTVCATGCDFVTLQAAIDDPGTGSGAVIEVIDATHTEEGIVVDKSVTIRGQGAGNTVVQAHEIRGSGNDSVFFVPAEATVTIVGMTIRHGHPTDQAKEGGGIHNEGTLTLENCLVSENNGSAGGGIHNEGTMMLISSTVSGNVAEGTGGAYTGCGTGGGIKNMAGLLTLVNSTVSGNSSKGRGGGIFVACNGTLHLSNSTISGNVATGGSGGGVYIRGAARLTNSTVTGNHAAGTGGGLYVRGSAEEGLVRGLLDLTNSIVANNTRGASYCCKDCVIGDYGTIGINANSLIEDGSCSPEYSGDPRLGSLADNGGATQTHALLPASPAIDAVPVISCTLTTDQRGESRPVGIMSAETSCDIGAFELQPD